MILTCPSCATRYQINQTALGGMGRRVRCVRCQHNWYQEVEVVVTPLVSGEPKPSAFDPAIGDTAASSAATAVPPPVPRSEPVAQPPAAQSPIAAPSVPPDDDDDLYFVDETAEGDHGGLAADAMGDPPLISVDPTAVTSRLPAVRRTGAGMGQTIGWVLLVVTIGAIVGGIWFGRDQLVAFWPPADRLYQVIDRLSAAEKQTVQETSAPQNKVGLAIQDVTHKYLNTNGANLLQVTGRVVNITDETRPVPRLRVSLQDKNTRELVNWVVIPAEPSLAPGAALAFQTEIDNAPEATRNLGVTFVGADLEQNNQK